MSENTPEEYGTTYTYEPKDITKGEAVVLITIVAGAIVAFAALFRAETKEQKKRELEAKENERKRQKERDEFNEWVDQQPSKGKVVIKPQVGTHIAIPVDAYKEVEIRRLPGIRY